MTESEREKLKRAITHLEHNPCEWEDAMAILYPLSGQTYSDFRKIAGKAVSVYETVATAMAKEE